MFFETWISFFVATCFIAISPGSGAVLSMTHGLTYGIKKTTITILGLQLGVVTILFLAGAGIGSILLASETAFKIFKIIGALYLIYLGWSQWNSSINITSYSTSSTHLERTSPSWRQRFLIGFLTNITNPKGIVFMVAIVPQVIDQRLPLWPQLFIMAATMMAVDLIVMHGYALAAHSLQRWLRDARALKTQNRFFGGILMAVGVGLFFVKRNSTN